MNIYLSAIIHIKENSIMDAIELLKKLVIETRKEKGCVQYDLFEDNRNKGVFFIHENWETNEDLHHHQVSDHMMIFRENIAPLLESANKVYVGNKLF
ncbi:MAG: antibiotic biosynthesis monooxygenase [Chryseobacterium sp. 36-9]|uniref:Quinol monooxygenase YgiN n=1 Tax=Epilithonimonas pallida TaxID=373671 RepID=A0ABY1R2M8_9FLAO|nr:putative quinol monooxygenase [Epilithonimonas pallida]OJX31680.1 MAG: antibiotic biosynthesis monooxygenase [Chryseobacterium sp. 36-9]SMP93364.1 Quinol monooxygenase YgiN [Epilithonimonas pallida]